MSYILGYRLAGRQAAWNCCDGGPFPRERNLLPRDLNVPLPESSEINRSSALHCERRDGVNLITIRHATVIFAPGCLLCVPEQIGAGDMVLVPRRRSGTLSVWALPDGRSVCTGQSGSLRSREGPHYWRALKHVAQAGVGDDPQERTGAGAALRAA